MISIGEPPLRPRALARLRERGLDLRDRLLASPRFHRVAAAFPLTRPAARGRARALFDLCAGFVYSQTLQASVRSGLIEALADGPQTVDALARRLGLSVDAVERLLDAAAALDLAARRTQSAEGAARYGLGALGAALRGAPGVAEMIEHHALLYDDLRDPLALLRGDRAATELGRYWRYASADRPAALSDAEVADYSALMTASQPFVAEETLGAYPIRRHRRLLDIGGGEGAFLVAAARRAPRLELMLFDLPSVAERARARFAEAGLGDRARVFGGSFFDDPLPEGADVVSLIRVIYDHDDAAALKILKAARRALPPEGALLLAEPMLDTPGAQPVGAAYFGFYLLAMGKGRPRRPSELFALLAEAGFERARLVPTRRPILTRLVVATAPKKPRVTPDV